MLLLCDVWFSHTIVPRPGQWAGAKMVLKMAKKKGKGLDGEGGRGEQREAGRVEKRKSDMDALRRVCSCPDLGHHHALDPDVALLPHDVEVEAAGDDAARVARYGTALRTCYAMPGTELRYAATRR
eukprot:3522574-Rhodomonas_salina.2